MIEYWYCPNCKKQLPEGPSTLKCVRCVATFEGETAWKPIAGSVLGARRAREECGYESMGSALVAVAIRLLLTVLVCGVIFVAFMITGLPYGGGSSKLSSAMGWVFTVGLIWSVFPVISYVDQER